MASQTYANRRKLGERATEWKVCFLGGIKKKKKNNKVEERDTSSWVRQTPINGRAFAFFCLPMGNFALVKMVPFEFLLLFFFLSLSLFFFFFLRVVELIRCM